MWHVEERGHVRWSPALLIDCDALQPQVLQQQDVNIRERRVKQQRRLLQPRQKVSNQQRQRQLRNAVMGQAMGCISRRY